MTRQIDYIFSLVSPWAYLGSARFHAMAAKHGYAITYRPVSLPAVFKETGGLPLAQRPTTRQLYRWSEMQRWRDHLKIPLTLRPKFFPVDVTLADRAILALIEQGATPQRFIEAAHAAIWVEDRNLADEAVVAEVLSACGHDAAATLAQAKTDAIGAIYAGHGEWSIANNVFGSPSYVLNGEIFWGQDRLPLLEEALASGRAPYLPV
ncbi:MAG: 2-hydroxychromene-2-carboxylate isomerase [Proteobacteria bacterium]|nr:2-hydroxychromene-2-carboxylate isomerase [Pseudomonadota bacterium]